VDKLIIEVRVNEYAMRGENPNVPWTPEEIGRDARAAQDAGASVIHFHARRPDGSPAHGIDDYAAAIRAIRANSDLLINPTLGQITRGGTLERIAHLEAFAGDPVLQPEIVGLDPGSTNIDVFDAAAGRFLTDDKVYVNAHATLLAFTRRFAEIGIKPALACWSFPFVRSAAALIDLGRAGDPAYVLLVHGEGGQLGAHPATPEGLRAYTDHLPRGARVAWSVCCKAGNLFPLAMTAIATGGHVAIGIGDYAYPELGHPGNADLVHEVARLARLVGRPVATPAEARAILGLPALARAPRSASN
jgi:uncharacterized protein (DUF849 family)